MSKVFKKVKKVFKKIAPIALPAAAAFIPGIGTLGAAALGAAGGAISGGGLKGALLGGITGAAGKALNGSGMFGFKAGTPLSTVSGNALLQGPTQGTGLAGALSRGISSVTSGINSGIGGLTGGGTGGINFNTVGNAISGLGAYDEQDDLESQLLAAQQKARGAINPFYNSGVNANSLLSERLQSGFQPQDLTNDPGYQFRLAEGNKSLERSLAAAGLSQSGRALKAAQEYGQGLADQTYNDAFNRWNTENQNLAQQAGIGYDAGGQLGDSYISAGDISANADVAKNNIATGTLSRILSGGGRRIIGYNQDGTPIYEDDMVDA